MEICGDNRFEIITKAKEHLLDATNIDTAEDEMKVIDSFLYRCWQMGWLDRYDEQTDPSDNSCKTCRYGEVDEGYVLCKYHSKAEQTEPNSSEKPNNCETEPQTDCLTCRYNSDEWDSPKCDGCSKAHSNYEQMTDCSWK